MKNKILHLSLGLCLGFILSTQTSLAAGTGTAAITTDSGAETASTESGPQIEKVETINNKHVKIIFNE